MVAADVTSTAADQQERQQRTAASMERRESWANCYARPVYRGVGPEMIGVSGCLQGVKTASFVSSMGSVAVLKCEVLCPHVELSMVAAASAGVPPLAPVG